MNEERAQAQTDTVRVDRWLWAARLFKTRPLAAAAVKGGKVAVNGERARPARRVRVGDGLEVRRGAFYYELRVDALAEKRLPAPAAAALYTESAASRVRREARIRELRALSAAVNAGTGRPTKRDRRSLEMFRRAQ